MGGFFRAILTPLRALFRFLDPTRDTAQAALIRMIAVDLMRQALANNPSLANSVSKAVVIVQKLIEMFGLKQEVAVRVAESVWHEVTGTTEKG